MLLGWGNYHRNVVASDAFTRIDTYVFEQLWRMLRRRHPNKSRKWLVQKYGSTPGHKWVFSTLAKTKRGYRRYAVTRLGSLGIRRHTKVKADANPYLRAFGRHFHRRRTNPEARLQLAPA